MKTYLAYTYMLWVKYVCGRLKSDYRYSKDIVYNNFPWAENPTEKQISKIEECAQAVLDARAIFEGSSLADLYEKYNATLFPETKKKRK